MKPQILIGAATSGSGKTTFTLGLLRALRNRGMQVQPFKCGPDYLDTKHHAMAAGRESYNLDTFMSSAAHVAEVYARRSASAEACITEGVMGLFDGYDRMSGSSAEIAGLLRLPVLLVLNARSTAYSVAPVLYGFKHFRPDIRIAGAIFNFVASEAHYRYLQQACEDAGVEALGYLPRCGNFEIPSRHLGLNIDDSFCFDTFADRIANQIEKSVNINRLLELSSIPTFSHTPENVKLTSGPTTLRRIAVAKDEAFNFIYPENLQVLSQIGEITFFSPLKDVSLPDADLVYLPGGYPELHLSELSANTTMREAIRLYCEQGGHVLAECGGMMYLCEAITGMDGIRYPVCGYLPQEASMENMHLTLGYRQVRINGENYRGHEFHYSRILPESSSLPSVAHVYTANGREINTPVYRKGNVIASYIHFYWGEGGNKLKLFVD